jgi:predicted phage baseplate assembly protein
MNTATTSCGCCEGVEKLTPMTLANRPGLDALLYRAGTYATFFETMLARLSNLAIDLPTGEFDTQGEAVTTPTFPLVGLTTRDLSDPAIALLDGWATVADVLTFYDERVANEGYLRTATERRSVLELARLIGYAPRPGVAATAYFAYSIEEDRSVTPPKGMEVVIPAGSRAQSVPEPDELPQTFETAEPLRARTAWNKLKPRMSEPQTAESIRADGLWNNLWLKGTSTGLKPNDPILIDLGAGPLPFRVVEVNADTATERTHVTLRPWLSAQQAAFAMVEMAARYESSKLSGATAKKARAVLGKLREAAKELTDDPDRLSEFVEREALPTLTDLHKSVSSSAKNLEPWLRAMIEELRSTHTQLRASLAGKVNGTAPKSEKPVDPFFDALKRAPSVPPRSAATLNRTLETALKPGADIFPRLMAAFQPRLANVLGPALTNASIAPPAEIKVYALRVSASLFGHNTPDQPHFDEGGHVDVFVNPTISNTWGSLGTPSDNFPTIALDSEYEQIRPENLMLIERPPFEQASGDPAAGVVTVKKFAGQYTIHTVKSVATSTLAALGVSSKVTLPTISPAWFANSPLEEVQAATASTPLLRGTRVYTQSELLPLAEMPISDPVCTAEIELDGLYDGLEAGRWAILSGERADVFDANGKQVSGIPSAELTMILSVSHRIRTLPRSDLPLADKAPRLASDPAPNEETSALPGDKTHTFVTLSKDPAYCYLRETMTIYGNVVKATHGETRKEVLGSGDASKPMQSFTLRQPPLTFLPAPTPAGAASTLVLRVNEVEWHETDTLAGLSPDDRNFITKTDDESKTTVVFGNGRQGTRPPTGAENITAVYRNGIGQPGNVKAGQISQLGTRPLGVKEVINPLPSTGGGDREGRDQVRKNAPLGVLALDRLVSVQDYADFTRTFAGIGKASAVKLSDGAREVVHVTIAGANDIPIDPVDDLYKNLVLALRQLGDPHLPIEVELREMLSLVISANVRVLPDYAWEFVEPKIRAALLDVFSFERRDLAQDVTISEVISVIQRVRGVAYVDLDLLAAVSESAVEAELIRTTINAGKKPTDGDLPSFYQSLVSVKHRVIVEPARADFKAKKFSQRIAPAQIAVLSTALPDTLVLTEVKA